MYKVHEKILKIKSQKPHRIVEKVLKKKGAVQVWAKFLNSDTRR